MAVASYLVNTMGGNQNENVWGLCALLSYRMEDSRFTRGVIYMPHGTANLCDFRLVRIAIVPSAHTILFDIGILHLILKLAPGSLSLFVYALMSTTPGPCAVGCCAAVNAGSAIKGHRMASLSTS